MSIAQPTTTTALQDAVRISRVLHRAYETGQDAVIRASEHMDARAAITAVLTTPDVEHTAPRCEIVVNASYSIRGAHVDDTEITLPESRTLGQTNTAVVVVDCQFAADDLTLISVIGSIRRDLRDLVEESDNIYVANVIYLINEPNTKE